MSGYVKVPGFIREQIVHWQPRRFSVGAFGEYPTEDLAAGVLAHLGVGWDGSTLTGERSVVPPVENGRWSRCNVEGKEHIRRDLPKVERSIGGWEVPNFGDSEECHTHHSTRKVYQRDLWWAHRVPIVVAVRTSTAERLTLDFHVGQVFDRTALEERDLQLACGLLQENLALDPTLVSPAQEFSIA